MLFRELWREERGREDHFRALLYQDERFRINVLLEHRRKIRVQLD